MIIKVKRPGLEDAVQREMAMFEEVEKSAFAEKLIHDVRATLEREMNLGTEAVEINAAQEVYNQGRVSVPPVVEAIVPSDSLVAISFVKGRTIDRVNAKLEEVTAALDSEKHTVNRSVARHYVTNLLAAQTEALYELTQLWFREAVFESGFFHGDLHSGNVFLALDEEKTAFERRFTGHHQITLIHFGNSGQFSRRQQQGVVEYAVGVARGRTVEVLDGLIKTGTIVDADRSALTDTVTAILNNPDLTFVEKSDWAATVCYAEGTGTARSLVSFLRARILLETQLADVNRRLDGVDPEYTYPRYTSDLAYREVVRS
jgi:predicted unusual protein kinase regulating ubiquinone biosynthesis (AarF/ABC1/UbiB family)